MLKYNKNYYSWQIVIAINLLSFIHESPALQEVGEDYKKSFSDVIVKMLNEN